MVSSPCGLRPICDISGGQKTPGLGNQQLDVQFQLTLRPNNLPDKMHRIKLSPRRQVHLLQLKLVNALPLLARSSPASHHLIPGL